LALVAKLLKHTGQDFPGGVLRVLGRPSATTTTTTIVILKFSFEKLKLKCGADPKDHMVMTEDSTLQYFPPK